MSELTVPHVPALTLTPGALVPCGATASDMAEPRAWPCPGPCPVCHRAPHGYRSKMRKAYEGSNSFVIAGEVRNEKNTRNILIQGRVEQIDLRTTLTGRLKNKMNRSF
ncbi:hypothetical protein DFH28DRAFT_922871 [Melampsora americana]|nr:hypothetical protein DFH28DRAFT_922871 [Melampsora americana]